MPVLYGELQCICGLHLFHTLRSSLLVSPRRRLRGSWRRRASGIVVLNFRGAILLQNFQRDGVQSVGMRGFQLHIWRVPLALRLQPAGCTQTPTIAWLQTRKTICWHWCAQIVALRLRVLQKVLCDLSADSVTAHVRRAGVAKAVSKVASHGRCTAWLKVAPKNLKGKPQP